MSDSQDLYLKWDEPISYRYFLVNETLCIIKIKQEGNLYYSIPSGYPIPLNYGMTFKLKELTKAEYETYIEFDLFPEIESDYFL